MNNEFAFPRIVPEGDTLQPGMTLRQWYAGMALSGIMANAYLRDSGEARAKTAFLLADEMIKIFTKNPDNEK